MTIREIIARAIGDWAAPTPIETDGFAFAVLRDLENAGYTIVPKEPTPEMEAEAANCFDESGAIEAGRIYRAMLRAHQ